METQIRDVESLEALFQPESALVEILDTIFDGIYVVDRTRKIVFWNRGAERTTGYSRDEVVGQCCANNILCHVDENGMLLCRGECPLQKTIMSGEPTEAKVYPYHKSRRRFPVITHVSPIRGTDGEIIGAIEVFRDVSKEDEFRTLQEKFSELIRRYVSNVTFSDVMDLARGAHSSLSRSRDVTIMFVDVAGFTTFTETHSPRETTQLLNDLFMTSESIIHECDGDIDKLIGDAVMAVFADANDAVRAGGKLLDGMKLLNADRAGKGREPIAIRIGIHSGAVVEGDVGGIHRKDRTIIGDAVNTASRIEKLCPKDSMLLSEATYARLRNTDGLTLFQQMPIRGKEEMLSLFTLEKTGASSEPIS
jgi:PAS domain S-box-containing protein